MLDILCESSARQMIHIKYHALFSLEIIEKIRLSADTNLLGTFRFNNCLLLISKLLRKNQWVSEYVRFKFVWE